ncbi:hypothetical protein U1Q18_005421 [Sarracenia purpurea var. burkii]
MYLVVVPIYARELRFVVAWSVPYSAPLSSFSWFAQADVAVGELDESEGVPGVPEAGASAASAANVVHVSAIPDGRGSPSAVVPSSLRLARGYLPSPKFRVNGWGSSANLCTQILILKLRIIN